MECINYCFAKYFCYASFTVQHVIIILKFLFFFYLYSTGVCNVLLRDCQYLQSLVTGSLHPDVTEIVYHLPVYTKIKNNLKKCIAKQIKEVDENASCPILIETQTILQGIPPFIPFIENIYH